LCHFNDVLGRSREYFKERLNPFLCTEEKNGAEEPDPEPGILSGSGAHIKNQEPELEPITKFKTVVGATS